MKKNKIISYPTADQIRTSLRANFDAMLDEMFGPETMARPKAMLFPNGGPEVAPGVTVGTFNAPLPESVRSRAKMLFMARPEGGVPVLGPTGRPVHLPRAVASDLTATQTNVLAHIKAHPGLRSEQIAKDLGLKPKDVSKVLKALREERLVKVRGKRRGTMYEAR
jgi:CRP-like cAMP-binding protein